MRAEPVLLLQGPRSVGKSTLLRAIAAQVGAELVDLDDVATRDAAEADPAMFVSGSGPVCIDEYQHVPWVLDAMKAELNRDGRPGRGPAWPHWAAELSRRESTQILACLCEHLTGTEFTVRCAGRSAASPKRAELGTDGAVVNV